MLRMLPAQQRLEAAHLAVAKVHLRLKMQTQLIVVERALQLAAHVDPFVVPIEHIRREEHVIVLAGRLRAMQSGLRMPQQNLRLVAVDRKHGDTDAMSSP